LLHTDVDDGDLEIVAPFHDLVAGQARQKHTFAGKLSGRTLFNPFAGGKPIDSGY